MTDFSRRPAPPTAELDETAVAEYFGAQGDSRNVDLRTFGVVGADGGATLAGWLALGEAPQTATPLARVSCLSERARAGGQRGVHIEGTVGALLDGVLGWFDAEMGVVQKSRRGELFDDLDTPREALREALSNALMHRSTRMMHSESITSGRLWPSPAQKAILAAAWAASVAFVVGFSLVEGPSSTTWLMLLFGPALLIRILRTGLRWGDGWIFGKLWVSEVRIAESDVELAGEKAPGVWTVRTRPHGSAVDTIVARSHPLFPDKTCEAVLRARCESAGIPYLTREQFPRS